MGCLLCLQSIGLCLFSSDIRSTHSENHAWSSAVFNSGVTSELNEIADTEHSSDMVTLLFNTFDNLNGSVELRTIGSGQLVLVGEGTLWTTIHSKNKQIG